jgi:hypothetical protein
MNSRLPLYFIGGLCVLLLGAVAYLGTRAFFAIREGRDAAASGPVSVPDLRVEPTLRPDLFRPFDEATPAVTATPRPTLTPTPTPSPTPTPGPVASVVPQAPAPPPRPAQPVAPPAVQGASPATPSAPRPSVIIVPTPLPQLGTASMPGISPAGRVFPNPTLAAPQAPPWLITQQHQSP